MQPPFDLNLMMTSEGRDPWELIAKAEAAGQLKRTGAKANAQALGWQVFRSVWISLKERAIGRPVSSLS